MVANAPFAINDQNAATQFDSSDAAVSRNAVIFANPADINKIILSFNGPQYVPNVFHVQVAAAGVLNPDVNNDAHWETIQSYDYTSGGHVSDYALDVSVTDRKGVRIFSTNKSNITDGQARIWELMAWEKYQNLAPSATITAPGWSPASAMNDEFIKPQAFNGSSASTSPVTLTWDDDVLVGGIAIHGGSGASVEALIDYKIQYRPDDGVDTWVDLISVTGNSQKFPYHVLPYPIWTNDLRVVVLDADYAGQNDARITEIFVFAPIPEPAAIGLLGAAGLLAMRRRR
jgi:hypothetical protein